MSDFLHELIHSLSTSEKIYFRRTAATHAKKNDKNYLKIYDCIEQLEVPNKDALKDLFQGTTIERYLPSESIYLKEKLLLSLFNFHLNDSKRSQIQKGIILVEVLIKKGFRQQALKKLNFVKKNAEKYEELTMLLRLIELEEIILFKEGVIGYRDKLLELKEQRTLVTTKIQNLNDYHLLREEIRETQFTENLMVNDLTRFQEICNHPLVQHHSNCMTSKAKEHWYYIQVLSNYLRWDFKAGLHIAQEYVLFMRKQMHLFSVNKLVPVLSNFIYHAALTRNKTSFELGLLLLSDIPHNETVTHSYLQYIRYTRTLEFSYYTADLALMEEYTVLTSALLHEHQGAFEDSQIQYLFMNLVRSMIVLKDFKLASITLHEWMQLGVLSYRKVQARLFSLLVHFELGYFELLQSELSILKKLEKRYLRDKDLIRAFYTFFNTFIKHPNRKTVLIELLQQNLHSIAEKQPGYFDFISFDYYQWSLTLPSSKVSL